MFRKFLTNPASILLVTVCALGALRTILPPPTSDDGVRYVQTSVGDKNQFVRINTNTKIVHYRGDLRWDDTHQETYAVYEKGGKLVTFAMHVDRPWEFREPNAYEIALRQSIFSGHS